MWVGFFAWYRGLAMGGALRVSQTQLLQPFLSILAAVPLLGEPIDIVTLGFAARGGRHGGRRQEALAAAQSGRSRYGLAITPSHIQGNNMNWKLAARAEKMNPSVIREILKVTERPGIISLAGGLPSPKTFPISAFADACAEVLHKDGQAALQYAASEGYGPLREAVAGDAAVAGRPGAGADHHRLAAGPGPDRQGAARPGQPRAGRDADLPRRAAGLLADGARAGQRGERRRGRDRRRPGRQGPGRALRLPAAQLPEPDRPHHDRGTPRRRVGRRGEGRPADRRGQPLRRTLVRRSAAAAAHGAQPRGLHLSRLVLEGAGAGPAAGLPGRAQGASTPSCCRPSRRPTCTRRASTSAWCRK